MAKRGTTRSFLATVQRSVAKMEANSEEIYQNICLEFYNALSAATPVDTGNLRNSLVASVGGNQQMVTGPGMNPSDSAYRGGAETSIANIMGVKVGDKVSYMYHAPYFRRLEYGFVGFDSLGRYYNQPGRFWVKRVGSQYRSIARSVAARFNMEMK